MTKLVYIGSPQFDGIGLLNVEIQKIQINDDVTILDGIINGRYPEIKNFSWLDCLAWNLVRKAQFFSTLNPSLYEYVNIIDLLHDGDLQDNEIVRTVLDEAMIDHCVCNNIMANEAIAYRKNNYNRYYTFLSRIYFCLQAFIKMRNFSQIVMFNGRNTIARLLIAIAEEQSVPVCWLEYFGKRDNAMTYIASPVDISDTEVMSDFILDTYHNCSDVNKELIAAESLDNRINYGDPLLLKWGVDFSNANFKISPHDKVAVAFFFASEDEYPAMKPSEFGLKPPNEQYHAFSRICDRVIDANIQKRYRFFIKLHPRYAAEKIKMSQAQLYWDNAIERARQLGIDFELVSPLTSAYQLMANVDVVFSYGTTAWEANYLRKPTVLMGPNYFSKHDCVHIANSIDDVIQYLEFIPPLKPIENCYPYAWALRELGQETPQFKRFTRSGIYGFFINIVFNRFSKISYVKES